MNICIIIINTISIIINFNIIIIILNIIFLFINIWRKITDYVAKYSVKCLLYTVTRIRWESSIIIHRDPKLFPQVFCSISPIITVLVFYKQFTSFTILYRSKHSMINKCGIMSQTLLLLSRAINNSIFLRLQSCIPILWISTSALLPLYLLVQFSYSVGNILVSRSKLQLMLAVTSTFTPTAFTLMYPSDILLFAVLSNCNGFLLHWSMY